MGFQEITSLDAEMTIAIGGMNKKTGKKNPTSIEGYYLGKREVESKKSKTGKAFVYYFQTSKGNVGVWGKTDLDRKMESATPGTMLRVSHTGMLATPNGEMYKFKVEFDPSNTITVAGSNEASGGYEEEEAPGFDSDEELDSYDSDEAPAYKAPTPALSASDRQAKVQALLAKKR